MSDSTAKERNEDSGLHDIRSLASSQRQRLSSRRLGTNPPPVDEDILASTSGSWKSIALPEPARMVALPDIAELPSKADLKAQQKAEKAAAKARKSRPSGEIKPGVEIKHEDVPMAAASSLPSMPVASSNLGGDGLAVATSAKVTEAPIHLEEELPSLALGTAKGEMAVGTAKGAVAAPAVMFGSRIAGVQQPKKSRAALFGALGLGLAAAAGAIIYVTTRDKGADQASTASAPAITAEPTKPAAVEPAAPAGAPAVAEDKADESKDAKAVVEPEPEPEPVVPVEPPTRAPVKTKPTKKPTSKTVIEVDDPGNGVKPKKEEPKPEKKEPTKEGDPDFEQLLKESGYQEKKNDKPKLEKKSLSGGDFKTGMAGVAVRAQGCYKGTQGTAIVKLTIAPTGKVSKVAVSGVGGAEASCVEGAVRAATFPPWDGGPQSFGYSYLLSE